MTIQNQVRAFIIESFLFGEEGSMPGNSASLIDNEVIDSTGVLELVAFIEQTFSVSVDDAEIVPANLDSVDAIARFVAGKTATAAA